MRFIRQVAALLFMVALPVALVTTNIRIAVNEPRVYAYAIDHYNTTVTTGITRSELLRASAEIRAYFNNSDDALFVRVIKNGQSVALFNEREIGHMRDVKQLLQATFRVQLGAVIFIMVYVVMVFLWARERSLRRLAREVLISGVASLALLGAFGIAVWLGFDAVFNRFHVIAFTNGNWEFDPRTDHLIQMFPDSFWEDVTLWVSLATLVELLLLTIASALVLRFTHEERIHTVKVTGELPTGGESVSVES